MRLICPNCDAEYEVDEAAIPEEGRDVLCSACGHSWFQLPPGKLAEKEEEAALFDPPSFDQSLVVPPEKGGEVEAGDDREAGDVRPPPEDKPALRPTTGGRSLDASLMAVLREEAARETAARRGEAAGIETQTEMPLAGSSSGASVLPPEDDLVGLEPEAGSETPTGAATEAGPEAPEEAASEPVMDAGALAGSGAAEVAAAKSGVKATALSAGDAAPEPEPGPATAAMRKIAELRGREARPTAEVSQAGPQSGSDDDKGPARRDLLPEIDEINSTLRDASETRDVDDGAVAHTIKQGAASGGGFRDGFLAVMVLVILGGALYLAAPVIAAKLPALQPAMVAYVHAVDGLRIGLDALVRGLGHWVSGLTGSKG